MNLKDTHLLDRLLRAIPVMGIALILTQAVPTAALGSTWNPTDVVNTESSLTIDDGDGTTNIDLNFGDSLDGILRFLPSSLFQMTRGLLVGGDFTATGSLSVRGGPMRGSGALAIDGNITLNEDNTAADAIVSFGNDAGTETFRFSDVNDRFETSDDLHIAGTANVTGDTTVDGNLSINTDNGATNAVLSFGNDLGAQTLTYVDSDNGFVFSDNLDVRGTLSGADLTISNLRNCDTVDTDATGAFTCGVDGGGGATGNFVRVEGDTMTGGLLIQNAVLHDPLPAIEINPFADEPDLLLEVAGTMSGRSLHVTGTGARHQFFTDVSTGYVGIGTSAPAARLEITEDGRSDVFSSAFNNIGGSRLIFRRARGTTDAPSTLTFGNSIGGIAGVGYTPTGFSPNRASISFLAAEDWTTLRQGTEIRFNVTLSGSTTTAEAMRVDGNGNVGINQTNPETTLDVGGSMSGTTLTLSNLLGCDTIDTDSQGTLICGVDAGGGATGWTDDGAVVRLTTAADTVGIGTTATSGKLHVDNGASDTNVVIEKDAGTEANLQFFNSGAEGGSVGLDALEDVIVQNSSLNRDIDFAVNVAGTQTSVMEVVGGTGTVLIKTNPIFESLGVWGDARVGGGDRGQSDFASEYLRISAQSDDWYLGVQNEGTAGASDFFIGLDTTEDGLFHIENGGDVGIGTTDPNEPLHIQRSGANFTTDYASIEVETTGTTGLGPSLRLDASSLTTGGNGEEYILASTGNSDAGGEPGRFGIYNFTDGAFRFVIGSGGRVGLGNALPAGFDPETALEVPGTVSGSSVVISSLKNCDTIDTNANGVTACGTDNRAPRVSSVNDTTTEGLTTTNSVILDNGATTYLALTPISTTNEVLVMVNIRVDADGGDSEVDTFEIRRTTNGTVPTCASTLVGSAMEIETTAADSDGWVSATFVDAPAVTAEVRYTVCGIGSPATASNDTNQITVTVMEVDQ